MALTACPANLPASRALSDLSARLFAYLCQRNFALRCFAGLLTPRFYVSTSKSIIKALINMHSFEIQLS
ncbi:hypothetical protein FAM11_18660, partial [Escherichia coli K-12]|uniref:hypothetical protein n=1 Tax=Escherichia coli TaxID=562 RepID=UPI001137550E